MAGPWEKYQKPASAPTETDSSSEGPWTKFAKTPADKPGAVTSAVRGAAQGLSLGFGDEIQGLMEAGGQAVGIKGLGANNFDQSFQKPKLSLDELRDAYIQARDEARGADKAAKEANPGSYFTGELVGGFAGAKKLPTPKVQNLKSAVGTGMAYGGATGLGNSEADTVLGMAADTAVGLGIGAAGGAAAHGAGKAIDAGRSLAGRAGSKLKDLAEKSAVNATGATGKQASNFSDDAGRELLDSKIVRFGDSQEKIAERAASAVKSAEGKISSSLEKLENAGVKVDSNDIYGSIRSKIKELKGDPSNADVVRGLEAELDNIILAADELGTTDVGIKFAEQIKRGYNRKAGNWVDPEKGQIGKELYQTYRRGVEDAAKRADPATAAVFEEGKRAYGLMAPIKEAAERRAATTAQSPAGGLLDLGGMVGGFQAAGPIGGVVAPIARRVVAPRIASTVAVSADQISKRLLATAKGAELARSNPEGFRAAVLSLSKQAQGALDGAPGRVADSISPRTNETEPAKAPAQEPKGGPEKWAFNGATKVSAHTPALKLSDEQKRDPKVRQLLIAASDLKAGSKAMEDIVRKITARIEMERN